MFRTKRLLALIMVIAMLMQTLAVSGFALSTSDFTDFPNDWSTEAMTAAKSPVRIEKKRQGKR